MSRKFQILLGILINCLAATAQGSAIQEVPGKALPDFLAKDFTKIRVYAAGTGGGVLSIPFQVDHCLAAPSAGDKLKVPVPLNSFSPGCRILFRQQDLGPRVDPSRWPSGSVRYESVADSAGEKVAYLVWEENPPPLSGRTYLAYDPVSDQVDAPAYRIGFAKGKPLIQDLLIIKNGANAQDILDRFKIRMNLAIKNFFDFKIDEGEIHSEILQVETGPIRVKRTILASKRLGPIKLIPKSRMEFYFYPDWVEVVSQIINPMDGPKVLEEKTTGVSGYDLTGAVVGSQFNSNLGVSFSLDGRPDPAEATLGERKITWWSLIGSSWAMVVRVKNDPKLALMGIEPSFVLIDDLDREERPEGEKGGIFLGFNLPYQRIPKGEYQIRVTQAFPQNLSPGQEEKVLAQARVAPPHEVRRLP